MNIFDRLTKLNAERQRLIDTLRMWDQAKAQGILPEHVKAWTFCDAFLSPQDKGKNLHLTYYNAIRLHDGSLVKLHPMIQKP